MHEKCWTLVVKFLFVCFILVRFLQILFFYFASSFFLQKLDSTPEISFGLLCSKFIYQLQANVLELFDYLNAFCFFFVCVWYVAHSHGFTIYNFGYM